MFTERVWIALGMALVSKHYRDTLISRLHQKGIPERRQVELLVAVAKGDKTGAMKALNLVGGEDTIADAVLKSVIHESTGAKFRAIKDRVKLACEAPVDVESYTKLLEKQLEELKRLTGESAAAPVCNPNGGAKSA